MGEAKAKQAGGLAGEVEKAPARPSLDIIQMKQAVAASKGVTVDPDTADFMLALGRVLGWIDHLEKDEQGETPRRGIAARAAKFDS